MPEEIKEIQNRLNYYKTIQQEPVYCEELIITGELQNLLDYIRNLQKEIERLNNIINELENKLIRMKERYIKIDNLDYIIYDNILNYLKELKESGNNE